MSALLFTIPSMLINTYDTTGISTGSLPYSPVCTYGIFLVLVSFQMSTIGNTPFGGLQGTPLLSSG